MVIWCAWLAALSGCGGESTPPLSNVCNQSVTPKATSAINTRITEADTTVNCNNTVQIGDDPDTEARVQSCECPEGWIDDGVGACAKRCESNTACSTGTNCVGGSCTGMTSDGDGVCVFNSLCGAIANPLMSALGACSSVTCDDYNECTIDTLTTTGCVTDFVTPGTKCGGSGACDTSGWCVLPEL
jgi:hypothetical protein